MTDTGPVRGRRRGPRWTSVSHGLHRPADDHSRTTTLAAWQLVLPPSGRFTHLTAAEIYGWWLPPLPQDTPAFATVARTENRPQRARLRVSRFQAPAPAVRLHGLAVDPAPEVLLQCARDLSLLDVVVLLDAALHTGSCSMRDIWDVAQTRRRGAPRLKQALFAADRRSESLWETMLRMLHVACEVAVQPQYPLQDEQGYEIARADLWICGTNALHEYDGEHHLSRPRQRKDLARARRIGNVAWIRRGYTSVEVLHQGVGILRDADLSLGREHRPERIRRWHSWLAESLFTPSGQQRFRRRIGLPLAMGEERPQAPA